MLLLIIIFVSLYLIIFKTDYFNIKSIEVTGNKKLSYDTIVNASLCNKGENIFRINIKKGEESINRLSYIKYCKIKRKLPNKILIEVVEREEVAIFPYLGTIALIDKEGYILTIENDDNSLQLPRIIGLEPDEIKVGENIFYMIDREDVQQFINTAVQLGLLSKMKYVDFSDEKNVVFQINDNTNVAFGSLDNVKYKLSFLIKIFEDLNDKGIKAKQIFFNKGENPIIVTDNR